MSSDPSTYELGQVETITAASVIREVKLKRIDLKTFSLPPERKSRIDHILDKMKNGGSITDSEDEDDEADEDDGIYACINTQFRNFQNILCLCRNELVCEMSYYYSQKLSSMRNMDMSV